MRVCTCEGVCVGDCMCVRVCMRVHACVCVANSTWSKFTLKDGRARITQSDNISFYSLQTESGPTNRWSNDVQAIERSD